VIPDDSARVERQGRLADWPSRAYEALVTGQLGKAGEIVPRHIRERELAKALQVGPMKRRSKTCCAGCGIRATPTAISIYTASPSGSPQPTSTLVSVMRTRTRVVSFAGGPRRRLASGRALPQLTACDPEGLPGVALSVEGGARAHLTQTAFLDELEREVAREEALRIWQIVLRFSL
jgi:hypothetical protein